MYAGEEHPLKRQLMKEKIQLKTALMKMKNRYHNINELNRIALLIVLR